jgi:PilZ domain
MEAAMTANPPGGYERRASPRTHTLAEHGISAARVRAGQDAAVLNFSAGGIFIETLHRLLPGTTIELQLSFGHGRAEVRGRVLRSAVSCLREGRVSYQGAIAFERAPESRGGIDGYALPTSNATDRRNGREDATRLTL